MSMKNSRLFDPTLVLNSEEVQLYKIGVDINATKIDMSRKKLKSISSLFLNCKKVKTFQFGDNEITKIENIPEGVKILLLPFNQITKIENIPDSVKELQFMSNKISKIENLPEKLEYMMILINPVKQITKQALEIIKKNKTTISGVKIDTLEVVDE